MPGLPLWLSSSGLAGVSIRVPELVKAPAVSLPTLRVKRSPKEKATCEGKKESGTRGVVMGCSGIVVGGGELLRCLKMGGSS